jgi:hypothetical protein
VTGGGLSDGADGFNRLEVRRRAVDRLLGWAVLLVAVVAAFVLPDGLDYAAMGLGAVVGAALLARAAYGPGAGLRRR